MDAAIERQQAVVAEHIRSENEHNWPAVYDTFVQDERAYYDVVPLGARFKGIVGVRGFYQTISAALPDLHIEVVSEYDVPGCSIREVIISGTHRGDFAGVKPLGNKIRFEMAAFYIFDAQSGKLFAERIYYDQAGVLTQMQAQPASAVA
jgi:predicted ester cyclase